MRLRTGAATDVGLKRNQNQDSLAEVPELGLFLVADGMGGHRGGEIASSMAVQSIPEAIRQKRTQADWEPRAALIEAFHHANERIFEKAKEQPELRGMGTTATALLFSEGRQLLIGNVGDSRCYFLRPHAIWQATRDHSLVAEKIRAGLITREQARTDRLKNVITRSVGFEATVEPDIFEMTVSPGDVLLLCSDGLSGLLQDSEILERIQDDVFEAHNPSIAVKGLIQAANSRGGEDNITAVIVEVFE